LGWDSSEINLPNLAAKVSMDFVNIAYFSAGSWNSPRKPRDFLNNWVLSNTAGFFYG